MVSPLGEKVGWYGSSTTHLYDQWGDWTSSLAKRQGSKTSAYLGTPDFKQNIASKLQSVRACERTLSGGNGPLPASTQPKQSLTWSFLTGSWFGVELTDGNGMTGYVKHNKV